jgi:protein O-GlcNAc transferase
MSSKVQALFQQGLEFHQKGQLIQAEQCYKQALDSQSDHFDSLHYSGVIAAQTGRMQLAVDLINRALTVNPNDAAACNNCGLAQAALGLFTAAIESYNKAILLKPDYVEALNNRGIALASLGKFEAAVESYNQAIVLKPDYVDAYFNRGIVLMDLKSPDAAIDSYDHAIRLRPNFAKAYYNRGIVQADTLKFAAAIASYDQAIALMPNHADAYCNRGIALVALHRYQAAVNSYDQAILRQPNHVKAHYNRGLALVELQKYDAAITCFEQAIAVKPDYAEAFYSRGALLAKLGKWLAAIESYERALAIKPDYKFLLGILLHSRMKICDWENFDASVSSLVEKIEHNEMVSECFAVLALVDSPHIQQRAAEIYVQSMASFGAPPEKTSIFRENQKIRIGYFSSDFYNHATAYLMVDFFEMHDRSRFELIAFSFGPPKDDDMRRRISTAFDQFFDIGSESDIEIAKLSRNLGVDIAVDLKGYTTDSRTGIFAHRCAPVQVSYLGYPATMGAPFIDYLIADKVVIPEIHRKFYTEHIAYLPYSYYPNAASRKVSDKLISRLDCGLPEVGFVFCCFNNSYKITPDSFDIWMRILNQVDNSVLWLLEDNAMVSENLRKEAQKRNIDSARLIFAPRAPIDEHLARHVLADLFLDGLPYNAHTTANDALWMGLPLITLIGNAFASRVAASQLNAIGLSELIASSADSFESLAVELATNSGKLAEIKSRLVTNKTSQPLFDTPMFTRHMEAAYIAMHERHQSGLEWDDIFIDDVLN